MIDPIHVYLILLSLLFFFWIYGIVSFVLDVKTKLIPGLVGLFRERRAIVNEQERESEQDEKKRELY